MLARVEVVCSNVGGKKCNLANKLFATSADHMTDSLSIQTFDM